MRKAVGLIELQWRPQLFVRRCGGATDETAQIVTFGVEVSLRDALISIGEHGRLGTGQSGVDERLLVVVGGKIAVSNLCAALLGDHLAQVPPRFSNDRETGIRFRSAGPNARFCQRVERRNTPLIECRSPFYKQGRDRRAVPICRR